MAEQKRLNNPTRRLRLGRRRPVARGPRLLLANYLRTKAALPGAPPSADYSGPAMAELDEIYLNDQLGDCVIAAGYHMVAVATGNGGGSAFDASPAQITADYSAIGGYVPGQPSTDQGCDEITALNYWCEHGFADGTKGAAWIEIDATDKNELANALFLFENVFLTLDLPDAYYGPNGQNAPSASGFVWDKAGAPNPQDGHAIVGVGYSGPGIKIDSWGMLGTMTWAALSQYCTGSAGGGAYAMLTPDILIKGQQKSPTGVDWSSLIDDINTLGANIPVITSAKSASAIVNQPFVYRITASNNPTSFAAENLPSGLAVNNSTGAITGKPTTVGTVGITVTATNANGSGGAIVTLNITAPAPPKPKIPVITSATAATATVGKPFTYRITASNSPTSFGASGLPAGLNVAPATGLISGTPAAASSVQVTLSASNAAGSGTAVLKLTVKKPVPPPTTPPHTQPPHTTPPHSSGTPPVTSSGAPPTSGEAIHFRPAWVPPPTYTIPPVPSVSPAPSAAPAVSDLGRQLLGAVRGSRKLGILAASGIVIQGLLAIVSMTDDESDKRGR